MTSISVFKRARGGKEQIDIQEAHNIFSVLRSRYISLQTVKFLQNFAHDKEWAEILDMFSSHYKQQITALEKAGKQFDITMPTKPPIDMKFATSLNEVTDEFIFKKMHHDMMAELMFLINAVRSTTTNDNLRNVITQDLMTHIKDFETLYKYGKLKGWIEPVPAYKRQGTDVEQISTAEAFHLWNHVSQRYSQIEITAFFLGFAHDKEFRAGLQAGLNTLKRQVGVLEEKALNYDVMLPNRPPSSLKSPIDPETLTDKFMYNTILSGILTALEMHIRAIIETIRNDSLRQVWTDLLGDELGTYDKFLKYGKIKGWINVIPIYGEPIS